MLMGDLCEAQLNDFPNKFKDTPIKALFTRYLTMMNNSARIFTIATALLVREKSKSAEIATHLTLLFYFYRVSRVISLKNHKNAFWQEYVTKDVGATSLRRRSLLGPLIFILHPPKNVREPNVCTK